MSDIRFQIGKVADEVSARVNREILARAEREVAQAAAVTAAFDPVDFYLANCAGLTAVALREIRALRASGGDPMAGRVNYDLQRGA